MSDKLAKGIKKPPSSIGLEQQVNERASRKSGATKTERSQQVLSQTADQSRAASRPVSLDGLEDDLVSYWSDSTSSQCDRVSSQRENETSSTSDTSSTKLTSKSARGAERASSSRGCNTSGGRNVRKRVMANERERERTRSLNQALEILRNRLPAPDSEKRSKIQTLRMAKKYIEFLAKSFAQQANEAATTAPPSYHQPSNQSDQLAKSDEQNLSNSPDSSLTYKFYKFRLKSQANTD